MSKIEILTPINWQTVKRMSRQDLELTLMLFAGANADKEAELDRTKKALEQATEWQPMETAPKDGEPILIESMQWVINGAEVGDFLTCAVCVWIGDKFAVQMTENEDYAWALVPMGWKSLEGGIR